MMGYCTPAQSLRLAELGAKKPIVSGDWVYDKRHDRTFIYADGMTSPDNLVGLWTGDELGRMIPEFIQDDDGYEAVFEMGRRAIDKTIWILQYALYGISPHSDRHRVMSGVAHVVNCTQLSNGIADMVIWLLENNKITIDHVRGFIVDV